MNEVEELKHRLLMVSDDLKQFMVFLNNNKETEIGSLLTQPTNTADTALTHLYNIEIACDLTDTECLAWREHNPKLPMLIRDDENKEAKFLSIVNEAKALDIDGETTEFLLDKIGMTDQMLKQLVGRYGRNKVESILTEIEG